MTAPTRVVRTRRATYAVDPYVRDAGGRFATHPIELPAMLQMVEDQADEVVEVDRRIDLSNGNGAAWTTGPDGSSFWHVRTVREDDGSYTVVSWQD